MQSLQYWKACVSLQRKNGVFSISRTFLITEHYILQGISVNTFVNTADLEDSRVCFPAFHPGSWLSPHRRHRDWGSGTIHNIPKNWIPQIHQQMDGQMGVCPYNRTVSTMKRNEPWRHAEWQRPVTKTTFRMILFMWNVQKGKLYRDRNPPVVAWAGRTLSPWTAGWKDRASTNPQPRHVCKPRKWGLLFCSKTW